MGGSAAETPTSPDEQSPPGIRASDADREQVAAKLRDEYVAGRLSHDTFLYRMNAVLEARRQADLPPLLADLPARPLSGQPAFRARSVAGWLRSAWSRLPRLSSLSTSAPVPRGEHGARPRTAAPPAGGPARGRTTGMRAAGDTRQPLPLQFPRGSDRQFSIGRDASCDLAIADMTVSRRHATLERTPDGWLLTDLESTNGTRVNGWRVRGKVQVHAGDLISFGNTEYSLC